MIRMVVQGLGTAIPSRQRSNDEWPDTFRNRFEQSAKTDLSVLDRAPDGSRNILEPALEAALAPYRDDPFRGVRTRPVLEPDRTASDLEVQAARVALDDAGSTPDDIDLLLITSHMPDHLWPTNGPLVLDRLGLHRATLLPLDLTCASFLAHIQTAAAYIAAGMARKVLSINSGTWSRFPDWHSPAFVNFGDGAAACVFEASDQDRGLRAIWSRTDGRLHPGLVLAHVAAGGAIAQRMEDTIGPMRLTSLDPAAGKQGGIHSTAWCREACGAVLEQAQCGIGDVDLYVGAQSLKWFPDACRRALGLRPEQVVESFDQVANLGAANIPYNLWLARERGLLRPGSRVLMYSPGAGLTRMAALWSW